MCGGVGVEVVVGGGAGCDAPHRRVVQDGEVINKNYFIGAEIKYFLPPSLPENSLRVGAHSNPDFACKEEKRLRRASEEAF